MNVLTKRAEQGFTIVELLIVVVVIAILAAITIVAYNGITARANDSARLSDSEAIAKAVELYGVEHETYGAFTEDPPASKAEVMKVYGIEPLLDRTVLCLPLNDIGEDCDAMESWDKTKIFIGLNPGEFEYAYWSNADNEWKRFYYSDDKEKDSSEAPYEDGPLDMIIGGGGVPA